MASDALGSATVRPAETGSWLDRAKEVWQTLYQAGAAWSKDNAMRLSAAVAMYTILSLSPLLVITIKILAVVFGDEGIQFGGFLREGFLEISERAVCLRVNEEWRDDGCGEAKGSYGSFCF